MVILLDRSGSMQGARWEWCRALGLAALLDARDQKRRVFLCSFTDTGSERMTAVGGEVLPASSEQFAALIHADRVRYEKLVRETGIKPD